MRVHKHPGIQYTFSTGVFSDPCAHIWFAAVLLSRCWAAVGCRLRNGTLHALMDERRFGEGSGAESWIPFMRSGHRRTPRGLLLPTKVYLPCSQSYEDL
ncbi:hypothetical protein AOLI_G00155540 [Acnodon oligacanthus]